MRSGQHNTSQLARRLGVTESHLRDWGKEYEKQKEAAFPGQGNRGGQAGELARLRRELERVTAARDVLKKAMAFLRERYFRQTK